MEKDDKKDEVNEVLEDEVIMPEEACEDDIVSVEDALKAQNAELIDKLQRSLAEFDNFRKRTVKEKSEMFDIGAMSTVERMLPVIDNLERALNAAPDKEDNMYKGILMIYKQLEEVLGSVNVAAIECIGEEFNPNLHNAVAHENVEGAAENIIVEELQKGYKYKDKVLRPSMVKVAN